MEGRVRVEMGIRQDQEEGTFIEPTSDYLGR